MQLVPAILFSWMSGLGNELVTYSGSVIAQKQKISKTDHQGSWNVKDTSLEEEEEWICCYMWLLGAANLCH